MLRPFAIPRGASRLELEALRMWEIVLLDGAYGRVFEAKVDLIWRRAVCRAIAG